MSTIVAIATAPGNAGIGIIRISGKDSFTIIQKIFKPLKEKPIEGYTMQYGKIMNQKKEVIDEVLVSFFVGPKSYTGENVCEINSHGNQVILNEIMKECILAGAVLAEPGEFTKRAFLNGRMDLLQAEAVMELIQSKSELERKTALKGLEGNLSQKIKQIKEEILTILTELEVLIDYPEYDIEESSKKEKKDKTEKIYQKLLQFEQSFENGKLLRDGVKVAIVGRPNVGKSSLLNMILKEERAIVTDIEGTTRDTIEEFVNIKGIPFKVIDTAGIRKASDAIEKIGIEKSKKAIEEADLTIAIFDGSKELSQEDEEVLKEIKNKKAIILLNKIDILGKNIMEEEVFHQFDNVLEISAKTGEGIENLYNKLEEIFSIEKIETDNATIITNIRHQQAIQKARIHIKEALEMMEKEVTEDILAIYYKQAIDELNTITGENTTEDMINDIFSKFCLGK